mgnify:FL=1
MNVCILQAFLFTNAERDHSVVTALRETHPKGFYVTWRVMEICHSPTEIIGMGNLAKPFVITKYRATKYTQHTDYCFRPVRAYSDCSARTRKNRLAVLEP